jgi:hypothetical protein
MSKHCCALTGEEYGRLPSLVKNYYLCDYRFNGFIYSVGDYSFDAASLNFSMISTVPMG